MTDFIRNHKYCSASSQKGKTMRRLIMSGLLLLSMFVAGMPAEAQTYEQAKKVQVEKALASKDGAQIKAVVNKYSKQYGVEPSLVHAIILTESSYNKNATSNHGAKGLMQLMNPTFKARNVGTNPYDIEQNVHAGTKHMAGLLAKYNGNVYLALAAYNCGGGNVDRAGKVPIYTKPYVNKVLHHKKIIESIQM